MAGAAVVSITSPLKDLSTVIMSDHLVVRRTETPTSLAGFTLACTTSAVYNLHNIHRSEREKAGRGGVDPRFLIWRDASACIRRNQAVALAPELLFVELNAIV